MGEIAVLGIGWFEVIKVIFCNGLLLWELFEVLDVVGVFFIVGEGVIS